MCLQTRRASLKGGGGAKGGESVPWTVVIYISALFTPLTPNPLRHLLQGNSRAHAYAHAHAYTHAYVYAYAFPTQTKDPHLLAQQDHPRNIIQYQG